MSSLFERKNVILRAEEPKISKNNQSSRNKRLGKAVDYLEIGPVAGFDAAVAEQQIGTGGMYEIGEITAAGAAHGKLLHIGTGVARFRKDRNPETAAPPIHSGKPSLFGGHTGITQTDMFMIQFFPVIAP